MEMKNLMQILLLSALLSAVFACKEKIKPLPGEIAEADLKPKYDILSDDSIVDEWGEPSPPPAVSGDGSSLFTERLAKRAAENLTIDSSDETPAPDIASVNWDDYVEPMAQAAASGGKPAASQPKPVAGTSAKPVAWTPVNDLNFDYTTNAGASDIAIISENGLEVLPYAANDEEKIDFLKSFYVDCFARDGRSVDESKLTVSCRRFLQDKVAETGDFSTGRYFRTQRTKGSKSWAEVQSGMTIKAEGDEWFKVEMDEGAGKKSFELKVVEIDGQLKIDRVKNKNV